MTGDGYFTSPAWRKLWKEIQRQTGLPAEDEDKFADTVSLLDVLATESCLETSSAAAEKELNAILVRLDVLHSSTSNVSNTMYLAVSSSEMSNIRCKILTMIDTLEVVKCRLQHNHRKDTSLQKERNFLRDFVVRLNAILALYGRPPLVQKKLQYVNGRNGCQELTSDNQWVYDVWALIRQPLGKKDKYKWRIESIIRAVAR